jgi:hypothetical protein
MHQSCNEAVRICQRIKVSKPCPYGDCIPIGEAGQRIKTETQDMLRVISNPENNFSVSEWLQL